MNAINRRKFLTYTLSAAATAVLFRAGKGWATEHAQMNMSGGMEGMSGMGGMHSMTGNGAALLPLDALPQGQPLGKLATLTNSSPTAGLFKAQLVAAEQKIELVPGKPTTFFTYNNHLPGQLIEAYEGDTVEIEFTNKLNEETTVHWHGMPVPPDQDGNPSNPVKPNETRVYRFTLPKGSAATYWYHTHAHNLVSTQAYKGLAGAFIVRAKNDPLAALPEQHWLFSDLRLDVDGKLPENTMMDWMNGREGQFTLINGQFRPTIDINGTQRIRVWNACNGRYLNLAIPNCELIVVGTDGGLLEAPREPVSSLLVTPGERYEIVVKAKQNGTFELQNQSYDRKKMMEDFKPDTYLLATVRIQNAQNPTLPSSLRPIPDLGKPTAFKQVTLSEKMGNDMNNMFLINGKTYDMARIDLTSKANEVEEWTVKNASHMDHPFHLHGTQFIVTERIAEGGKAEKAGKALKDTVNLRPGETVKFKAVQQDEGIRMFHCHILEHENLGMMAQLKVVR